MEYMLLKFGSVCWVVEIKLQAFTKRTAYLRVCEAAFRYLLNLSILLKFSGDNHSIDAPLFHNCM